LLLLIISKKALHEADSSTCVATMSPRVECSDQAGGFVKKADSRLGLALPIV
jgi:hypothetical protein